MQNDHAPGRSSLHDAVNANTDIIVGQLVAGRGVPDLNRQIAAPSVDNVFHFLGMEMRWRHLTLKHDQDLLCVVLAVLLRQLVQIPVADGEKEQAGPIKLATAEVSDVPAEQAVDDSFAF